MYRFEPLFYKHSVSICYYDYLCVSLWSYAEKKWSLVWQPNLQRFTHENQGDDRLIYPGCGKKPKNFFFAICFAKCTRCVIFHLSIDVHVKFLLRLSCLLLYQCRWLADLLRRVAYRSRVTICLAEDLRKLPCNG